MSKYTDEHLQDHELGFWLGGYQAPLIHAAYYQQFFNFKELNNKKVVEVGCGGSPITEYNDISPELTLVDPILNKLLEHDEFKHLSKYEMFSVSLLDFQKDGFDYAVCLNCIDHFNDPECLFVDKFWNLLNKGGELWLYYDVRSESESDHLALDHDKIMEKIQNKFDIKKIDLTTNPTHAGWGSLYKSVRLIASKK